MSYSVKSYYFFLSIVDIWHFVCTASIHDVSVLTSNLNFPERNREKGVAKYRP